MSSAKVSKAATSQQRGPHLPALLRLASQAMTEQLTEWIAASGFAGVQPAHSAVFQPLWQMPEGARITALARASRITKQSMSTLITDLEAGGYVERVEDPDARALLSVAARREMEEAVRRVTKVETATEPEFQAQFVAAMAFPHATAPAPNLAQVVDLPARSSTSSGGDDRQRRRRRNRDRTEGDPE